MAQRTRRPGSLIALLVTALVSGAVAGLIGAGFIWVVESGVEVLWSDLPEWVGVDAFSSWWLFAVPIAGGVLVGLGQRFLGNYPQPLERVVAGWRSGVQVDPKTIPATFGNSFVALVAGGPVGFEAALTGLIGGTASWIGGRIRTVGQLVRQAWGAERVESLPAVVRKLPYWLAALSGLVTYKLLPFGEIDISFRFQSFDGVIGAREALVVFCFAVIVTVPASWAIHVVTQAEGAVVFRHSPVLIAMGGAVLFATLALGNEFVLFSGQQAIQNLDGLGNGELIYLMVAKWLALVIALVTGWRGGPIFPTYLAVAALGMLVAGPVDVRPDLVMVAGAAAIGAVFVRGSIPVAFLLTLYVAPFSFAGVILLGVLGAAAARAVGGELGILPEEPTGTEEVATDSS